MIASEVKETSQASMLSALNIMSSAGASLIQVRTREPLRAAIALRHHFTINDTPYHEWDVVNGFRTFSSENFTDHKLPGDGRDFIAALRDPLDQIRSATSAVNTDTDKVHYFAFINPVPHVANNPYPLELIQQYAALLPSRNVAIVFITGMEPLPGVPLGTFMTLDLTTPTAEELRPILTKLLEGLESQGCSHNLTEEDIDKVVVLGLGLSLAEFDTYCALTLCKSAENAEKGEEVIITVDDLLTGVAEGKTAVVKASEILELLKSDSMENVGGMQRLKDWITKRKGCYSPEAKEFGVEPPKGLVLVGVPGSGKSLSAKSVASELGIPLVRMDFGRVFSKYVGDSEQRVLSALRMAESMAPCVLFVDEIDKGLGGIGQGGGDSGVSIRVLGTYLTWLQELKAPVFNMVTANRVDGLPPELLRKGRFDQIFSVGLPFASERREVLRIHMLKRGWELDMGDELLSEFDRLSQGFVPAEIEGAVKDAMVEAFSQGESVSLSYVNEALKNTIPMSRSHKDSIERILAWAENNAIPVSYPEDLSGGKVHTGKRRISLAHRTLAGK